MSISDSIKRRAGLNGSTFNDDITALIEAAKDDLLASGVPHDVVELGGSRVDEAIICYALAHNWWDAATAEHYEQAYQRQIAKLSLSADEVTPC